MIYSLSLINMQSFICAIDIFDLVLLRPYKKLKFTLFPQEQTLRRTWVYHVYLVGYFRKQKWGHKEVRTGKGRSQQSVNRVWIPAVAAKVLWLEVLWSVLQGSSRGLGKLGCWSTDLCLYQWSTAVWCIKSQALPLALHMDWASSQDGL